MRCENKWLADSGHHIVRESVVVDWGHSGSWPIKQQMDSKSLLFSPDSKPSLHELLMSALGHVGYSEMLFFFPFIAWTGIMLSLALCCSKTFKWGKGIL